MNLAKEPSPAGELVIEDPLQGITLATNIDNLSAIGKRPKYNRRTIRLHDLGKENEKGVKSIIGLDLKTSYPAKITTNLYLVNTLEKERKYSSAGSTLEPLKIVPKGVFQISH